MPKKVKRLTRAEAQALIEDVRRSAAAGVRQESAEDAGTMTIEALEKALGKDWARTSVEVP